MLIYFFLYIIYFHHFVYSQNQNLDHCRIFQVDKRIRALTPLRLTAIPSNCSTSLQGGGRGDRRDRISRLAALANKLCTAPIESSNKVQSQPIVRIENNKKTKTESLNFSISLFFYR